MTGTAGRLTREPPGPVTPEGDKVSACRSLAERKADVTEPAASPPAKTGPKLTPADRRQLQRDLATAETTRAALARKYGVSRPYITEFAKTFAREIDAIKADLGNEFAGLWIASKEQRLAAYERDYDTSEQGEYGAHYEQVRTRAQILRNVAEELGQLPSRGNTAIIVPVVHVVEGIDLDALR